MNMDVSRQCALVLLMKLCQKLKGEEGKERVIESGRSLFMKRSLHTSLYTGCNRRNGPDFGRVFLMLTLILRCSRKGTVWFYTSTSNKRAARPKLYTKSLTRDLKLMYSRLTMVRISLNFRHRASCI